MENSRTLPSLADCFDALGLKDVIEISKESEDTRAWFALASGKGVFLKLFPNELDGNRLTVETEIAGGNLHPAIVPLRRIITCELGTMLVYDRLDGENLGPMAARGRLQSLPLPERIAAASTVVEALVSITDAGFMIVDWYEGNMIYDFEQGKIWLFDWELCRKGIGFTLQMDSNFGSSRLMAPEEFVRGSLLDQRTIVFNLGRYVLLTLPELADSLAPVLARATYPARSQRYCSVRQFTEALAWALAR